jgi:hypothetical protein
MNPDALSSAVFIAARVVARWAFGLPLGTYAVTPNGTGSVDEPRGGARERMDPVRVRDDLVVAFVANAAQRRMSAGTRSAMEAARGAGEMVDVLTRATEILEPDVAAHIVARARRSALTFLDLPRVWPLTLAVAGLLTKHGEVGPEDLDALLDATMEVHAARCAGSA